jgi:S-adenosylmethionine hydrolase
VFLSDYGLGDEFVGVCHIVLANAGVGQVVDLTHAIPPQDVFRGGMILAEAVPFMPRECVYLAVVDPGVGGARRSIAVETNTGAFLVGPDNGLLSLAWEALDGIRRAVEITSDEVMLSPVSHTFHGRDIFAPAAAHLATGMTIEALGAATDPAALERITIPQPLLSGAALGAEVLSVDRFGNVRLNVRPADLEASGIAGTLSLDGRTVPLVETFSDVPEGQVAALFDSQERLALFLYRGNAAKELGLQAGSRVTLGRG